MRAVIPVAGIGTRLRPHTHTLPKVLLNVAGKPILGHILDKLVEREIRDCTIVVGYMADKVEKYVRGSYDLNVTFVEQKDRQGLGHSIWTARETFDDEPLLIILGDTIFDVDFAPVLARDVSSLGVKHVDDPRRFGVAETNADGVVTKLIEKPEVPTSNLALVGLYYVRETRLLMESLNHIIDQNIRTRGEYQLTDALQVMIDRGAQFDTFGVDGWYDCGKPETLLATNRHLLEQQKNSGAQPEGCIICPPSYVAPSAQISHSVIGPYATVADGAIVENSIIRNSIVGSDARVQSVVLDESIIGNKAFLRGGANRLNVGDSSEIDFSR